MPHIEEGQLWLHSKKTPYRIGVVYKETCELFNADGTIGNKAYKLEDFENTNWSLLGFTDESIHDCPECGERRPISPGDFKCRVCRESEPKNFRVIATINEELNIVRATFDGETLAFHDDRSGAVVLQITREDLSRSFTDELQEFVHDL